MGFWNRLLYGSEAKASNGTLDLFREIYGSPPSKSGQTVTWKSALQVSVVLACATVRANGIAQVPFRLMRETGGQNGLSTKLPATDHALFDVLHRRPNPWQTSFELRQTMELHRVLCGNAFAFLNRVGGRVVEIIPFEPGWVTVKRNPDYSLTYTVRPDNGQAQVFPAEAIWHLRGASWNSWMGMEAVKLAREAIGLAMASEESQARLHEKGVQNTGVYSVEGTLRDEQYEALRKFIEKNHAGSKNAGLPMILDRNAKWLQTQMTGVDAQHLETRKFQVEEVCRTMGVFPQMIGYTDKAPTYASAEQFFGAHVVHTLGPGYEAWEQSADVNLLTKEDRQSGLFCKFFVNGLLRGNIKDRGDFYTKMYGVGALNPNEIRALEDMNPYDGGDKYRVPLNMEDPNNPSDDGKKPSDGGENEPA